MIQSLVQQNSRHNNKSYSEMYCISRINIDMADRTEAVTDTLETFRTTYNSTANK